MQADPVLQAEAGPGRLHGHPPRAPGPAHQSCRHLIHRLQNAAAGEGRRELGSSGVELPTGHMVSTVAVFPLDVSFL